MRADLWRSGRFWGFAFAVFTAVGLSHAAQSYTGMLARVPDLASWRYALVGTVPFWYAKFSLLPLVMIAGSRWRVSEQPVSAVALHLVFSLVFAAVQLTMGTAVAWSIMPPPGGELFTDALIQLFSTYFVTGAVFYWVFLGTYYAIDYARQFQAQRLESRELALRASELQGQLSEARLQALRSQLNPHFLFNALNAVGALCDRNDTRSASLMVTRIGELLRMALEHHDQMTTLEQELHFVDTYLDVEQVRVGSRLTVERDVGDDTRNVAVPSLLLQPLVENAIRHGVGQQPGPARVRIVARMEGDSRLFLRVEDSGPGFDFPQPSRNGGVGLRNTVARLEQLYGDAHTFAVATSELGGARVDIVLPVHAAARNTP